MKDGLIKKITYMLSSWKEILLVFRMNGPEEAAKYFLNCRQMLKPKAKNNVKVIIKK
jgi:hypothetical protein